MIRNLYIFFALTLLAGISLSSCKKETEPGVAQVEFSINLTSSGSTLKSASVSEATFIVITIEDSNGKVIKNSEKLELYNMDSSYITQPLSLVSGNYKLTRFLVLDASNKVMYASPVNGSVNANLVEASLPIPFSVTTDYVTKLVPQVLKVSNSTPESFGYSTFSFNVTETFDFLVGAFIYNKELKNYQLTTATISILSDTAHVYTGELKNQTNATNIHNYDSVGITNKITLPSKYDRFTLNITKAGYKDYNKTFTRDELKLYYRSVDKGPLVVILDADTQVQDTTFYMRGYFGSEYVNFTNLTVNNYVYTYTTPVSCNLHFIAYEKSAYVSGRSIGFFASSSKANITNVAAPITVGKDTVTGELQYSTGDANPKFGQNDSVNYLGVAGPYNKFSIVVEKNENFIMSGKFSGEMTTMTGKKIKVTNGEFRGKVKNVPL